MTVMPDWIWAVVWLQDGRQSSSSSCELAVALAHNVVMRYDWKLNRIISTITCEEKCILYPYENSLNCFNMCCWLSG